MFLLRNFYNLIILLLLPFVFLRLLIKGCKSRGYKERWLERLGVFLEKPSTGGIWVHCVSVGEVMAAVPLVNMLQRTYPNKPITFTTMTPTGSNCVRRTFGNRVFHVYVPYDFNFAVKLFLDKIAPKLCIIFETELWPNIIYNCNKRSIPILLANARISPNSINRYRKILPVTEYMLNGISLIAAQSAQDEQRFLELGCDKERLYNIGNIKFDVSNQYTNDQAAEINKLKKQIGTRPVLLAASTHAGEEKVILSCFKDARSKYKNLLLIIVPRHPERFTEVEQLISDSTVNYVLRSEGESITENTEIMLGDTMGELKIFYNLTTIAYIGGSLVPVGGHNMLEASVCGVPVVTGSKLHNFEEISNKLMAASAMKIATTKSILIEIILDWLDNPKQAKTVGTNGLKLIEEHQGITQKLLSIAEKLMSNKETRAI